MPRLPQIAIVAMGIVAGGCDASRPRQIVGTVVSEHGDAVSGARVTIGYHDWAWEPYLVWDHFYSAEDTTDPAGRFRISLDAPARLLATVETEEGAIRTATIPASDEVRLVTPTRAPSCRCWHYEGGVFLVAAPIGAESTLTTTTVRERAPLQSLPHRVLVERASDTRTLSLTIHGGDVHTWWPTDGIYGSLLDYHPPLDQRETEPTPVQARIGMAKGVLALRTDTAWLLLELDTGFGTQRLSDGGEAVLLPARWARRQGER